MSDAPHHTPLPRDAEAQLAAMVPLEGFGTALLAHVRQAADIANLGAFLVPDLDDPHPELTIWSGRMSDYWFNRNARRITADDALRQDFVDRIRRAPEGGLALDRWRPPQNDPRAAIYRRDGVIERVSVASRAGRGGYVSFYLRGEQAGWLSSAEMTRLRAVLPLAHELIGLRHRITGAARATASGLRDRAVEPFTRLSPREAEVCDMAVRDVSVAGSALALGISENSVRTLRKRAWRKLGVGSVTALATLVLAGRS